MHNVRAGYLSARLFALIYVAEARKFGVSAPRLPFLQQCVPFSQCHLIYLHMLYDFV